MAPHSSTLAWKIPWMEEPEKLQSMGLLRVRHDWATSLSLFTFMHWIRKWQPIPVFLPGESQGRGAWWAAIYGVAQSRTQLTWLSSSSSSSISENSSLIFVTQAARWGGKRKIILLMPPGNPMVIKLFCQEKHVCGGGARWWRWWGFSFWAKLLQTNAQWKV